jgi:hypothetical protein
MATSEPLDPIVEAYLPGIDRTLIAKNLRLSVEERFRQLMELQRLADELKAAKARGRPRRSPAATPI